MKALTVAKNRATPIISACILKCSPETHKAITEHSELTGVSMKRIVDDMAADWLECVAPVRLEAFQRRMTLSQFEKNKQG